MADKEKNKLMYSDKEITLIKAVFSENDLLLKSIRRLFFGATMTEDEKKLIVETFANEELKEIFRKKVYGFNNLDTQIGHLSDFWLGVEQQIFGASRDTVYQAVESKNIVLSMFIKAFDLLSNPDGEKVDVNRFYSLEADPLQVHLMARNLYMKAIETSLLTVQTIAGQKEETLEQTLKRLQKDSSK